MDIAENGSTDPEKRPRYPMAVFFIVVTEFCERFAYYGMRAVLTIYMRTVLNFSDDLATTIYHVFLFLCYFLPLFGAILADSFVGKYTTVLALSATFAGGNILLALASTPPLHFPMVAFSMAGLALMAMGTGGIKPCVVALGGDQFILPHQESQLKQFFSMFVFAVSVGNMCSTVLTPVLRSDVTCFNQDCYPLAFGIPAALMLVAIVIFVLGKPLYKINQPKDNIILRVTQCIIYAVSRRQLEKKKKKSIKDPCEQLIAKREHWVDYADHEGSKFDRQLIQDTKGLLRVLVYYLPIPMFWALYEQLGSRWTLQATGMDGNLGHYSIKPDQMQVANAILMFIFIPVFETMLYPLLAKCNLFKRPLQRMVVGGLLAALSFSLAGIIEMRIEKHIMAKPTGMQSHLNVINTLPCQLSFSLQPRHVWTNGSGSNLEGGLGDSHIVAPHQSFILPTTVTQLDEVNLSIVINSNESSNCFLGHSTPGLPPTPRPSASPRNDTSNDRLLSWSNHIPGRAGVVQTIIVTSINSPYFSLEVLPLSTPQDIEKSREGLAKLRILELDELLQEGGGGGGGGKGEKDNIKGTGKQGRGVTYKLVNKNGDKSYLLTPETLQDFEWQVQVPADDYMLIVTSPAMQGDNSSMSPRSGSTQKVLTLKTGGNYILILQRDENNRLQEELVTVVEPNSIHMLWLLPQYITMAWAEILFIISGMEFSFTEAPTSMKSVLQACWHLTNATGNLLVIIAAQNKGHSSQATEFLVFAALMLIDTMIFALMATRYKYISSKYDDDVGKESNGNNDVTAKNSHSPVDVRSPTNSQNDAQDTRL